MPHDDRHARSPSDTALHRWALAAKVHLAQAIIGNHLDAELIWQEADGKDPASRARALERQRAWIACAGPLVPGRLLQRPAPRVFLVAEIPAEPRSNALWYRAMSTGNETMIRCRCEPSSITRVLLFLSRHAVELGRAFPAVANLRHAVAAFAGFLSARPSGDLTSFLGWFRGLRELGWLRLPSGGSVYDWEVLARPRSHVLHVEPEARRSFEWLGLEAAPLATLGEALDWFARLRHGDAVWLALAELKASMLFAVRVEGRPATLVVSLGPGPELAYAIEVIAGEDGAPLPDRAQQLITDWHRLHPGPFRLS